MTCSKATIQTHGTVAVPGKFLANVMACDWQDAFQEATHETDPVAAEIKMRMAEVAIFNRINDFSRVPDAKEEQALFDALGTIRLLKGAGLRG